MIATTLTTIAASPLEKAVLTAVRAAQFDRVLDFSPANEDKSIPKGAARRGAHPPNVDVAVIQLDTDGRLLACANVLLARDYPDGLVVPVDVNTGANAVRFRRWDIDRWNGGTFAPETNQPLTTKGWTNNPPFTDADDIVPGRACRTCGREFHRGSRRAGSMPRTGSSMQMGLISAWTCAPATRGRR